MHKRSSNRPPSASLVVSIAALVVALSSTAVAAGGLVGGDRLIKPRSLSGNRLRPHTLSGAQIDVRRLGVVPHAALAERATRAERASRADLAGKAIHASSADLAGDAVHAWSADTATYAGEAASAGTATLATAPPCSSCRRATVRRRGRSSAWPPSAPVA